MLILGIRAAAVIDQSLLYLRGLLVRRAGSPGMRAVSLTMPTYKILVTLSKG